MERHSVAFSVEVTTWREGPQGRFSSSVGERAEPLANDRTISERDIARRAYEIYESRGGTDGRDVDDWLQAERELLTAQGK